MAYLKSEYNYELTICGYQRFRCRCSIRAYFVKFRTLVFQRYKRNHLHRVELKIHSAEVGHLIGESGERLKDIIQKSGAKIKFRLDGMFLKLD